MQIDMMNVLYAVLALAALGAALGVLLALASRVFAVKTDERVEAVLKALPGANCGGCGYAGCATFAQAVADGQAEVGGCPVGGEAVGRVIADIMGIQLTQNTRLTAMVQCSGGLRAKRKFDYVGLRDCHAAMRIGGGPMECPFGCLGLGSCVKSCPFGAIQVVDGVAVVDHERCTGCLRCTKACPKHIIHPVPYFADVNVACSSKVKGAVLRRVCEIGCLGCRMCEKVCQHGAIHVRDNLAEIDFDKCTGCGDCAEKCPRKLILDAKLDRGPRVIAEDA
jgi:Na+-translocating ferredoxin:NAD+ oxidoreductase RNF subunit RnfB